MAAWAADCAERVLIFFERDYPGDSRPREALKLCRRWIDTGHFSMADITVESHLPLMLLQGKLKQMSRLRMLHVPLARRWQLPMCPSMLMAVHTMPSKQSQPLILPMPKLRFGQNTSGSQESSRRCSGKR